MCEPEPLSLAVPPEAEPFLQPDSATHNRPFSLKHAQQQVGGQAGTGDGAQLVAPGRLPGRSL